MSSIDTNDGNIGGGASPIASRNSIGGILRDSALQLGILEEVEPVAGKVNRSRQGSLSGFQNAEGEGGPSSMRQSISGGSGTGGNSQNQAKNGNSTGTLMMNDLYGGDGANMIWGVTPTERSGHASCICDGGSLVFVVIGGDKRNNVYDDDIYMLKIV
eukprot:GDKK01067766.1.p1 GENE.GDKK01067766.1~~GDKK01067766.1.p1  ORF type:complete len:158 (-),score=32.07 GDKK01067766.1:120-593(-)